MGVEEIVDIELAAISGIAYSVDTNVGRRGKTKRINIAEDQMESVHRHGSDRHLHDVRHVRQLAWSEPNRYEWRLRPTG
jgi:hypothetical protein